MFDFNSLKQARIKWANSRVRATTIAYAKAETTGAPASKVRAAASKMQSALKKQQKLVNPSGKSTRKDRH